MSACNSGNGSMLLLVNITSTGLYIDQPSPTTGQNMTESEVAWIADDVEIL